MKVLGKSLTANLKPTFIVVEIFRKIVQLLFLLLLNSAIFGLAAIPLTLPILFSSGLPFRVVDEALSVMQKMIYDAVFPFLPLASILIFGALTGRFLCGWACPLGLIQDILAAGKTKKITISPKTHKSLINAKYIILGLILLMSASLSLAQFNERGRIYREMLGSFAQAPFTSLSPSDTLLAVIPRLFVSISLAPYYGFDYSLITPILVTRIIILVAVLFSAAYVPRAWCRYLCPQGAFSALVSRFSLLGLKREPVRCVKARCHVCEDVCPMKVPILSLPREKFTDPECIYCLRCVTACPTKAIKLKFP
ncbi:MAG: 4Fe-4S binding protein [Candidatus Bathyarchaeia archaeon]